MNLRPILLRDQHPELHTDALGVDSCTQHGLELSPEKKGKGKRVQIRKVRVYSSLVMRTIFDNDARGGLAARASAHFERTRTNFILWAPPNGN